MPHVLPAVAHAFQRLPRSRTKVRIGRVIAAALTFAGVDAVAPVRLLDGTLVVLDLRGRTEGEAAWNGTYAPGELCMLKACTPRNGLLLDVGANVGLVALPMALYMAPAGGRVVAIEPVPANLQRLHDSARLNGLSLEIEGVALGDKVGSIPVTRETGLGASSGNAVVGDNAVGTGDTTIVELTTLDHLAAERAWGRVDTMKVDVEGYEVPFLRGAAALLARDRPVIVGEFNSHMMPAFGHTFLDVGEICDKNGYRIVAFRADGAPIEVKATVGLGNVALVPAERLDATMRLLASMTDRPTDRRAG